MPIPKSLLPFSLLACLALACSLAIDLTPTAVPTPAPSATLGPTASTTPTETSTPPPTAAPTDTPVVVVERGQVPPGFSLTVYATVPSPTSLTFGPDGRLYVASADQHVYVYSDETGSHRATLRSTFASGLDTPLGLLWIGDQLLISYNANVVAMRDTNGDGVEDQYTIIVPNLPIGLHQNDGMVPGADGYVYMGLGTTCDVCAENSPLSGSILRFKPDGSDLSVYATGFRNPYDVAFNAAGDLFATDNGRDKLGDDIPPEELNHIRAGLDYGWPDCWEGNTDAACTSKAHAVATFTAHSSVDGLTFYNATNFPPEYRDNAFAAVFGSYLLPQIERGVKRIVLSKQGDTYTGQAEWFLQLGTAGRPLDLTVGPDGGLYVADFAQGEIYRIVYGAP